MRLVPRPSSVDQLKHIALSSSAVTKEGCGARKPELIPGAVRYNAIVVVDPSPLVPRRLANHVKPCIGIEAGFFQCRKEPRKSMWHVDAGLVASC